MNRNDQIPYRNFGWIDEHTIAGLKPARGGGCGVWGKNRYFFNSKSCEQWDPSTTPLRKTPQWLRSGWQRHFYSIGGAWRLRNAGICPRRLLAPGAPVIPTRASAKRRDLSAWCDHLTFGRVLPFRVTPSYAHLLNT